VTVTVTVTERRSQERVLNWRPKGPLPKVLAEAEAEAGRGSLTRKSSAGSVEKASLRTDSTNRVTSSLQDKQRRRQGAVWILTPRARLT